MEENIKKTEISGSNRIINDRIKKIEILRSKGVDPYPSGFRRENIISEAKNTYTKLEDESSSINVETENFVLSGRVMSLRIMGKATFFDIPIGYTSASLSSIKELSIFLRSYFNHDLFLYITKEYYVSY